MTNMTWLELRNYIDNNIEDKDIPVIVYDLVSGEELNCDILELKENDAWRPCIAINLQELEME